MGRDEQRTETTKQNTELCRVESTHQKDRKGCRGAAPGLPASSRRVCAVALRHFVRRATYQSRRVGNDWVFIKGGCLGKRFRLQRHGCPDLDASLPTKQAIAKKASSGRPVDGRACDPRHARSVSNAPSASLAVHQGRGREEGGGRRLAHEHLCRTRACHIYAVL